MDTPPKPAPAPNTAKQVSSGLAALQALVAKSKAEAPPSPPTTPPPPAPIDTGSFGGLLQSLKDRVSYAMFGPPTPTPGATPPGGPVKK